MTTRINSATDAYRLNEADVLGNGKDDTTSANAGRSVILDVEAGLASTTTATDGDLRVVDTVAEALSADPTANTTGNATLKYSRAFLLRWLVKLIQPLAGAVAGGRVQVDIVNASTLAVSGPLTNTELRATPVPVSGNVTANTGLAQPLTDTQIRATPLPISGTVSTGLSQPLTDAQARATPLPVSGTVTANTGLSQPLTDTQLRATPLPVSGTVSTGLTQPLTDAQLRATPIPVSGTVSTGLNQPLTDAQLRATPLPVSGTVSTGLAQPLTDAQLRAAALTVLVSSAAPEGRTINTTTANLQATDAGAIIYYDNVADGNITIPIATIAARETVQIMQINTGKATLVAGTGATLRIPTHPNSPTTNYVARTEGRYATITVFHRGSEEFVVGGRLGVV
ncbi:hypothetical protein H6F75_00595 [Nodosilinea sp. FACHB-131]|uniref:hypothetical protein n=1 Tax=Cyanophyceae TaxID=3028117 RepID=UPI0016820D90|nr:hypothetical protein [Nodosilinea sp. FACHB-131]MBD1871969.1 hypothetical protein [Nodosilinea sp. FACHB-131]